MFENYYRKKAQASIRKMNEYNEQNLNELVDFNDAVRKYQQLIILYGQAERDIKKLPSGHIDSLDLVYYQIENHLNGVFNRLVFDALKQENEKDCLEKLNIIKSDLSSSNGYGFDQYISKYQLELDKVIDKYKIIYKNYKNNKGKAETSMTQSDDSLYNEIVDFVVKSGKASASLLQRKFRIGYNKATTMIDELEENGIIGPATGYSKPRMVLVGYNDSEERIPKTLIDFCDKYGTDYEKIEQEEKEYVEQQKKEWEEYVDNYDENAQKYFEARGLDIKFSKEGHIDLEKLKNTLFTNTEKTDANLLINRLLEMSRPNELKLALIDTTEINMLEYNGLSNLFYSVVSDYKQAQMMIERLCIYMKERYKTFLDNKVKNITVYNELKDDYNKMPYIVVVISEFYEVLNYGNIRNLLSTLLLNCEKAGIVVMGFSKLNKRNIQLMMLEDLFVTHSGYSNSYMEYNENNISDITNIDDDMDGFDFEKYSAKLLSANGFEKVEVTQCSNDYGVDVIAYKDDIKYAIQCKKYTSPVGIKAVQEVIGSKSMNGCHVGVVLTNNTFTKSAKELAEKNNVLLWDRRKLMEMIKNLGK